MATAEQTKIAIRCASCGKEQATKTTANGKLRLPRGWKSVHEDSLCNACFSAKYGVWAVLLPVTGFLGDGNWETFREVIREQWDEATRLSQWAYTEMYVRDVRREPDDQKLKPMSHIYLYPEARKNSPHYHRIPLRDC